MKNYKKYARQYFKPPVCEHKWVGKEHIEKAPFWCSVDLRDGNQSLIVPMSIDEKIDFFELLVKIGFKEIEVGFPAASETEFAFLRRLIEENRVPDDVTIQVLTQAREHIIKKTFESLKGAENAIVHFYNSTSAVQREQVFKKSKEEIIKIAVDGARLLKDLQKREGSNFRFQYSPESFTGTEPEFALEICNAVLDVLEPAEDNKVIINLPVTVQHSMPHIYANQVEYMCGHLKYRENVIVSLHPHNDRGCAVADTELGLLAGADRVEGTLFGNGERTGNVDIITLALNMYSHGVSPELDFSNLPGIVEVYERVTKMQVYERMPYSGALVFAAFSGSHQDAIAKGAKWREDGGGKTWNVPYLPIDPVDIGREYETDVIRINSQSGKGGIGYLLERNYGFKLPVNMREVVGYYIKHISDTTHKELSPAEVYEAFKEGFVNVNAPYEYIDTTFEKLSGEEIRAKLRLKFDGAEQLVVGEGNGRLDAVGNALSKVVPEHLACADVSTYEQHALERTRGSKAVAYVGVKEKSGKINYGVGVNSDIAVSGVKALFSAVNRAILEENEGK